MNIVALAAGVAILAILATAGIRFIAKQLGWRETLRGVAFSLTGTALIVAAALLISYGTGGFS